MPSSVSNKVLAAALVLSAFAPSLAAQCIDASGNLRPCPPAPVARPAPPPIDDRRWIVLPFTNRARAADLDWLSATSASLLSIDMSRWSDVRVVDDERVADLLRNVPEARRTQLGLDSGLAIAKRAGAGRLVMGDFLKEGTRTSLTAKVYNVRTGARIRIASEQLRSIDSVSATYSRLAPKVLALAVPPGMTLAGMGTTSTDAIQSYTLGMLAYNRGRSDSAGLYLLEAIRFDSAFALAHFRLAGVIGSTNLGPQYPGGAAQARATAARFAGGLPERERLVIASGLTNCERGSRLLALDSADAEGWLATGQCIYSNLRLVPDGAGGVLREISLDAARRAFERVLALQPSSGAIVGLQLWRASGLSGCIVAASPCPPESRRGAALVYDGDTLSARFERVRRFDPPARRREFASGRRARLTAARAFLAPWSAAHPEDILAHNLHGEILTLLGDFPGALREFEMSSQMAQLVGNNRNRRVYFVFRAEAEWHSGQADRAAALIDSTVSLGATPTSNPQPWITAFGRFSQGIGYSADTARRSLGTAFAVVFAGVVPENFDRTMRAYAAADTANGRAILEVGTALAFHALRARAAADTASEFSLFRFQAFLALGDTARAQRALAEYDVWGNERADDYWDAYEMFAAESHLELADTATAWARIEPLARRWPGYDTNFSSLWLPTNGGGLLGGTTVVGRAWLLYADLAMATGHRDDARRGYTMIVGMWEHGEAPVQPLVTRAKAALAKLGG